MQDKKIMFLVVNMLITTISLAMILGAIFLENEKTKFMLISIAITIIIVQKILEIIYLKETRKVSAVVLGIIVAIIGAYFLRK